MQYAVIGLSPAGSSLERCVSCDKEQHQMTDGLHGCKMATSRSLDRMCLALRGFWTMAPLRYAAKFDPFLTLDRAPTPHNPRKGRDQILQSGGEVVCRPVMMVLLNLRRIKLKNWFPLKARTTIFLPILFVKSCLLSNFEVGCQNPDNLVCYAAQLSRWQRPYGHDMSDLLLLDHL